MKLIEIVQLPKYPDESRLNCQPNRTFKERPVYDDAGNIVAYTCAKYDPENPPLAEDVEDCSNFNLKDPNEYASVILANQSENIGELPPYDAFTGTQAVENAVNNFKA